MKMSPGMVVRRAMMDAMRDAVRDKIMNHVVDAAFGKVDVN